MEEALLFLASSWADLASVMRLWRIWAYSFCFSSALHAISIAGTTYGSILGSLCAAALECDAVALVLEALGSDQTLDLRGLGVGLCALLLGLDLTADDELTDLHMLSIFIPQTQPSTYR
jgi:hypothetical protein